MSEFSKRFLETLSRKLAEMDLPKIELQRGGFEVGAYSAAVRYYSRLTYRKPQQNEPEYRRATRR